MEAVGTCEIHAEAAGREDCRGCCATTCIEQNVEYTIHMYM